MTALALLPRLPALAPCEQCRSRFCGPFRCRFSQITNEEFRRLPACGYRSGVKCAPGCNRRGDCLDAA
jgi:hypothetical protein